ncbi:MAG TPA: IclR family transcriptional regulator C-terminal domain-containing protein [Nocardioidaceae bacterium]|nr:IclR family transcriptional regulator C-terminal domain-containing protein [Nocardioidaceae bacterium]
MEPSGNDRDHIQSLERGFAVLLAFSAELPDPTLADLAAATGFSRPAVRRILLTLQRLGYVRGDGGRWSLTPRVLTIGQHYAESHALVELSQPHLLRLAEETQESASLAALDETEVVYIARVQVRRIMSINVDVGTRVPTHATSMGRVLLAWASKDVVDAVIDSGPLPRFAPNTITNPRHLRDDLRRVREQGWAIVENELEEGLLSASAPVRDGAGDVVAALAYSTSSGRKTTWQIEREVVPLLVEEAEKISAELGAQSGAARPTKPKELS